jgi:hypothetical protein
MKTGHLLLVPCLCFASCALLTHGGREKFTVLSEPSGANVALSSGESGVTPATFQKGRKDSFTVTVTNAGYAAQTVDVSALKPNPVSVHLSRRGKSKPAATKTTPEGAATTPKKAPSEATPSVTPVAPATASPTSSPIPETTPEATATPAVSPIFESTPVPEVSPTP